MEHNHNLVIYFLLFLHIQLQKFSFYPPNIIGKITLAYLLYKIFDYITLGID
jgi:hypothetical protein